MNTGSLNIGSHPMAGPHVSSSRKRKHRAIVQPQETNIKRCEGPPKRQWNSTTTHHAPGFWDSLSQIFLTHRALKEFDRREALKAREATTESLTPGTLVGDIKRFARTGGPDLLDIVGVNDQLSQLLPLWHY